MSEILPTVEISFAVSLMENLVTPTFVLNSDGYVVIWNKACERLTGLKSEDVIGTKNHWRGFYESPRVCLVDLIFSNRLDTPASTDELYENYSHENLFENTLKAENWCVMPLLLEKKYLAFEAGPIYDSEGKLIAAVETLMDLTELKETQSALEKLTNIDPLTNIGNRRFFEDQLKAFWLNSCRYQQPLTLLMLDIDFFKKYNDFYGHPQGDKCITAVATRVSETISRSMDMVFRYGGEEFCILLPDTNSVGAARIAEKIIASLVLLAIEHKQSPISDNVTVSIGVFSYYPTKEQTPYFLLEEADKALYEAKSIGRNRFVVRR